MPLLVQCADASAANGRQVQRIENRQRVVGRALMQPLASEHGAAHRVQHARRVAASAVTPQSYAAAEWTVEFRHRQAPVSEVEVRKGAMRQPDAEVVWVRRINHAPQSAAAADAGRCAVYVHSVRAYHVRVLAYESTLLQNL